METYALFETLIQEQLFQLKKIFNVWGKLLGIAFVWKSGNKNASTASLYLNPLQLRIADTIDIGPKDIPKILIQKLL
tara:strand:+ start:240 stop:470 length:231 start_codon:yes stop_codon:yes gene_type:complete